MDLFSTVLKLYYGAMITGTTSPLPHLFGPPGSAKSSTVRAAADALGVTLHTVNASRISPLELEGIQMPTENNESLRMLHSNLWTSLKEGDIVLWDEFLAAFPEVYNGLLDIFTSREVAGYKLPRVFMIAASNSVTTSTDALRDRLEHIPVPDIRKSETARKKVIADIIKYAGLHPDMHDSPVMNALVTNKVSPMYALLDQIDKTKRQPLSGSLPGTSPRKIIGLILMRHIKDYAVKCAVNENNSICESKGHSQYFIAYSDGSSVRYEELIQEYPNVRPSNRVELNNMALNSKHVEMYKAIRSHRKEQP